jgi:probable phosphoglycerate mutase
LKLYLIRHADPDYANDTITPQGHLEAEALSERLTAEGIDVIYSSPLGRAVETAQYTASKLQLDIGIEDWAKELQEVIPLHMQLEGYPPLHAFNLHGEEIRKDLSLMSYTGWSTLPHLQGTRMVQEFERVSAESDRFIQRLGYERIDGRYRCIRPNRNKVAVFAHGGLFLTWMAHLLAIPLPLVWSGFWLPPTSVTTILFDERTPEWAVPRCLGVGDVPHLYKAGLPVLPRGIIANLD